eukprot:TRINITY_DN66403_c3_g20_i1.p1 TRINITY_DN66403_c3_g20~~TRINITY_DN66403_c3_g20_i1.p1  ORF type:complete len:258 (-),score=13.53 TRINITY_DN66403_c3_g20_i1:313-1086(-)
MDVWRQRLDEDYHTEVITTAPNVTYQALKKHGKNKLVEIQKSSDWVPRHDVEEYREPMVKVLMVSQYEHETEISQIVRDCRGSIEKQMYTGDSVVLHVLLPLSEMLKDFYHRITSATHGYTTIEYEPAGYRVADLCKVDIQLNGHPVDVLSVIMDRARAPAIAKGLVATLKEKIPRRLFDIYIQAFIDGKSIGKERIKRYRQDVTAKCYGGDNTRKDKLLERQKGYLKKIQANAMERTWNGILLPQDALLSVLHIDQ